MSYFAADNLANASLKGDVLIIVVTEKRSLKIVFSPEQMREIVESVTKIGFFGNHGAELHDQIDGLFQGRKEREPPMTFLFRNFDSVVDSIEEEMRFSSFVAVLYDETGEEGARRIIGWVS
jgi:hypothetical protein